MYDVRVRTGAGKFGQVVEVGPHRLVADERVESGGEDTGPEPHDFLLVALGCCTSMTVKMYADRKGWPLREVEVELSQKKEGEVHVMARRIRLVGDLSEEQRGKILEIANKCPVHRTLMGEIRIDSVLT
jgi:putative redox protein